MKTKSKIKTGELIFGKYRGPDISPMLIKQFPFEIWIVINSTITRIQVQKMERNNKLTKIFETNFVWTCVWIYSQTYQFIL